jgi:dipeptidyl-peptidase-4
LQQELFDNEKHLFEDNKIAIGSYEFSKDEQKMLLFTEASPVYRRSVLYKVYVFDLKTENLTLLDTAHVLHASFDPSGTKVAFVKDNNLFYKDLSNNTIIAVTQDGKNNEIINGNCDWVYEEEFQFTKAFEWSPNGRYLAFYRFDERQVPEFSMDLFTGLYPEQYRFKYPKAGEVNSIIQIKFYNLETKATANADLGEETDIYIPRIKWSENPTQLCILRMNRLQNKLEYLLADARSGKAEVIYTETNPKYIEINDDFYFLPDNQSFLFTSEQDGYRHLYRWNWVKKTLIPLSRGKFDVDGLTGVDVKRKLVYYTAAVPDPTQRKLYATGWDGKGQQMLTPEAGTHAIVPINGFNYFLDRHSGLHQVPVFYLRDRKGKIVRVLVV